MKIRTHVTILILTLITLFLRLWPLSLLGLIALIVNVNTKEPKGSKIKKWINTTAIICGCISAVVTPMAIMISMDKIPKESNIRIAMVIMVVIALLSAITMFGALTAYPVIEKNRLVEKSTSKDE